MRRRSGLGIKLILLCVVVVSGCSKSPSLPTSAPLLFHSSPTPTPSLLPAPLATLTSTPSPPSTNSTIAPPTDTPWPTTPAPSATPTATPLPTWPDRWQQTGGPAGGAIAAAAVSPANPSSPLAAGLGGAVYQSQESTIWQPGERVAPPHDRARMAQLQDHMISRCSPSVNTLAGQIRLSTSELCGRPCPAAAVLFSPS